MASIYVSAQTFHTQGVTGFDETHKSYYYDSTHARYGTGIAGCHNCRYCDAKHCWKIRWHYTLFLGVFNLSVDFHNDSANLWQACRPVWTQTTLSFWGNAFSHRFSSIRCGSINGATHHLPSHTGAGRRRGLAHCADNHWRYFFTRRTSNGTRSL